MLAAETLDVHLGKRQILFGVEFTALPGEVTAIVGPNGSGKTTLLRALTGDIAYRGTARIGGLDVARAAPWELAARRAVLAQFTRVAFPFTVAEVVAMGAGPAAARLHPNRTAEALARVGLTGYGNRPYHDLSGGEQQRAQLARVLTQVWEPVDADGPRWLILDEPVASLDIAHQLEVMGIARDFAAEGGGVVAVMHDLNLTALYAQNVALMAAGRVVRQGAVNSVFTDAALSDAYGCPLRVSHAPANSTFLLPHAAGA